MLKWMLRTVISLFCMVSLSVLTGGCSSNFVDGAIVRQGISLSLGYTQGELSQYLRLPNPDFQVQAVNIDQQKVFLHDRLPTYHVQGHYDLRLKFPHQTIAQKNNPFDLYLQQQIEGKSWRLLLPSHQEGSAGELWQSFLLEQNT